MPDYEYDKRAPNVRKWVPGELVVALRDLPLVQFLLQVRFEVDVVVADPAVEDDRPGDSGAVVEPNPALGLGRIRIGPAKMAEIADRIRAAFASAGQSAYPETAEALRLDKEPVDLLLATIRDEFAAESLFGKWMPVVDKNVVTDAVHAAPYVSVGADNGYPDPLANPPAIGRPEPKVHGGITWVDVGILDTGLYEHPLFRGRWLWAGRNPLLVETAGEPWSHVDGHATFIAGTVLQRASNARMHVGQVLRPVSGTATVWDVATTMMDLATSVNVLNLSFACYTDDGSPPLALRQAIDRLDPTTVVVAAAGNHGANPIDDPDRPGPNAVMWPAAFDRVIAVGAHDGPDKLARFSPDVVWVRLLGPGVGVNSTYLPGPVRINYTQKDAGSGPDVKDFATSWATWSGTSFAAAAVSGEIAKLAEPRLWGAYDALDQILSRKPGDPSGIWRARDY